VTALVQFGNERFLLGKKLRTANNVALRYR
jgi:hypothetical protein